MAFSGAELTRIVDQLKHMDLVTITKARGGASRKIRSACAPCLKKEMHMFKQIQRTLPAR